MKIDTPQIPVETGRRLGESLVNAIRKYLEQPGAIEKLEAQTMARERRKAHEAALSQG